MPLPESPHQPKPTNELLHILKSRRLEVGFIVGLPVLGQLTWDLLQLTKSCAAVALGLPAMLTLMIIGFLLALGFVRTAHLYGPQSQGLVELLRTGAHFFWRMFVFSLLFGMLIGAAAAAVGVLTGSWQPPSAQATPADRQPAIYLSILASTGMSVLLAKVLLLVPAIIIVRDARLFKSFTFLRNHRLLAAGTLLCLFGIQLVLPWLNILVSPPTSSPVNPPGGFLQQTFSVLLALVTGLVGLMLQLAAVQFVGGLNQGPPPMQQQTESDGIPRMPLPEDDTLREPDDRRD